MRTDAPTPLKRPRRRLLWGFAILVAAVTFLVPIASIDLSDARETHLGADAMDTLRSGEWLVVWDREAPRLKKPPLARWAVAASLALGGRSVFFLRLPGALCMLGAAVLVGVFARRIAPPGTRAVATILYATTGIVASEAWVTSAEQILALTTTAALLAAWRAEEDGVSGRSRTLWLGLCGLLIGVGILAKGPIAILFVLLPLIGFTLGTGWRRSWRTLLHPALWLGLLVVVVPWLVTLLAAWPNAPDIWREEMAQHTAAASGFKTPMAAKYFLLAAPWVPLAIAGIVLPWHPAVKRRAEAGDPRRANAGEPGRGRLSRRGVWFAWWWVVGNVLVFTLFVNPRSHYFVPIMPGVAVLCTLAWAAGRACDPKPLLARFTRDAAFYAQPVVLVGGYVALPFAAFFLSEGTPARLGLVAGALVLGALGVAAIVRSWRRGRRWSADFVRAAAPLGFAAALFGLLAYPTWVEQRSYRPFAERARAVAEASSRTLDRVEDKTANLPLHRRIRLSRELDFYLDPPPRLRGPLEALPTTLETNDPALFLLTEEQFGKIQAMPALQARRLDRARKDEGRHAVLAEVVRVE